MLIIAFPYIPLSKLARNMGTHTTGADASTPCSFQLLQRTPGGAPLRSPLAMGIHRDLMVIYFWTYGDIV